MLLLLQHIYLHLQRLGIWEPQAGRQAGRQAGQDRCLQGERITKKKVPETKPEDLDCRTRHIRHIIHTDKTSFPRKHAQEGYEDGAKERKKERKRRR
jgi:hypothetical protein